MPKAIQIAVTIPTGVKAQNEEWITTDHPRDDLGKLRCNFVVSSDVKVEYTLDGGTNWFLINGGLVLKANCSYGFDIYVVAGDLINFRTPTAGGTTLLLGRLVSIKDEI